ncbi:MAG: permease-like cell division protein FtsX [Deltaproteobacteria bacterium]|nr:permease-like cell division protein FtsX [Deltaproteobacteria bacterium]
MTGAPLYFFRRALANIAGERTATGLTLSVVTISFLIFGVYVTIAQNAAHFMSDFAGRVQIVFDLRRDADALAGEALASKLRAEPQVAEARYVSPADALDRLRRDLTHAPDLLHALTESPLPASVEVTLKAEYRERPDIARLIERYAHAPIVDAVDAGDEFMDAFTRVLAGIWVAGVVIGAFLMVSAVFIVANTIRLTIIRRRGEIENMRLVGATNAFVKAPFLIEGILVGATGALAAAGGLYLLYRFILVPVAVSAPVISVFTGFEPVFLPWRDLAGASGSVRSWAGSARSCRSAGI